MLNILHDVFLLISAIIITGVLNVISLASLAAILIIIVSKLAQPSVLTKMYKLSWEQFVRLYRQLLEY
ncbi:MAG: hypothetical protein H7069_03100 [Phormidesmis sp. FL-bin-119]|nr:hypothetical protein [Pedobacter sp.]